MQQLLTESLLLSTVGGALGALVAWAACQWMTASLLLGGGRTPQLSVVPDVRVLGFTIGLSMMTGVAFGLAPLVQIFRRAAAPVVRNQSGSADGGVTSNRMRKGLIVEEVGLVMVLLVAAGLFVRTESTLRHVETRMDRPHVLTGKPARELDVDVGDWAFGAYNQTSIHPDGRHIAFESGRVASTEVMVLKNVVPRGTR